MRVRTDPPLRLPCALLLAFSPAVLWLAALGAAVHRIERLDDAQPDSRARAVVGIKPTAGVDKGVGKST